MTQILEPNRFVPPNYVQYLVSDRSGRVFSGLIASETPSSLTLRRAEGAEDTILRSQIEELASTGKSLMPENFATKLTHQEMADLIAYLLSAHRGTPESGRPRDRHRGRSDRAGVVRRSTQTCLVRVT